MEPLVTVITPTIPERRTLLRDRCIPSVQKQDYPNIEHIVVGDGEVPDVLDLYSCRSITTGRNWHRFSGKKSWGAMPRVLGTLLARGGYITYIDDDDELLPGHVSKLVALLEKTGSDFAVSQSQRLWADGREDIIHGVMEHGRIGTCSVLHKASCLLARNWAHDGYAEDWELFRAWDKAGLKHCHLPEITAIIHKA